jgi:hypothetical protein
MGVQHDLAALDQPVLDDTLFEWARDEPFGIDEDGRADDKP